MSLTASTIMPLGTKAPDFKLENTIDGSTKNFKEIKGEKGTLVMFICNHCPYVIHVIHELTEVAADYKSKGIGTVAISSNDIEKYPDDSPENMKVFADDFDFTFPYLYDESQEVAKAYDAVCTPDIYLFDSEDKCFYHGRLDESRPGNDKPVNGKDLRAAIERMLNGDAPPETQHPSAGCNIKWK